MLTFEMLTYLFIGVLVVVAAGLFVLLRKQKGKHEALKTELAVKQAHIDGLTNKYGGIINAEKVVTDLTAQQTRLASELFAKSQGLKVLEDSIAALRKELSLLNAEQEIAEAGHYRPTYNFQTSEAFKLRLEEVRNKQRDMIRLGTAATCTQEWVVGGDRAAGKRLTKDYLKLVLRAFNGESDAIIANVRWNNINRMVERLNKAYDSIGKLADDFHIKISGVYYRLKDEELRLTFEYEEKLRAEKEAQRRIQEQIREEEKAQREIEKALKEAADEETRYQKALEKARAELATATTEKSAALISKVAELESKLEEALRNKQRAMSRAEMTKSGHVYVISNVGSFGEGVFKIGMTRRLEPMDRIWELSDASVPFDFDVHAMIYTENAPELEKRLHDFFTERRVNLVNDRKEFFQVTPDELEKAVGDAGAKIEFLKIPEAREYRETLEIKKSATH